MEEGQIIQRGPDRFLVRVYLGRDGGKRRYANRTVKGTRKEASKVRTAMLRDRDQGLAVAPGRLTLGDYLDRWLKDSAKARVRARTHDQYSDLMRLHVRERIGSRPLAKLSPLDIQAVYSAMTAAGLKARTVRYAHTVLFQALEQAKAWRLLPVNPAENLTLPRIVRTEMQVFTAEQARAFLASEEGRREYPLWHFAIATGMRPSEILGAKWADLTEGAVSVRRTVCWRGKEWTFEDVKRPKSRRTIELDADTLEILRKHKAAQAAERLALGEHWTDHGLIFPAESGRPIVDMTLVNRFKAALKRAKLPNLRLYDLRHTAATLMLMAGIPAKVASERLGHSTAAFTLDVYSHVLPNMQKDAATAIGSMLRR